jgi:hypothetical protein
VGQLYGTVSLVAGGAGHGPGRTDVRDPDCANSSSPSNARIGGIRHERTVEGFWADLLKELPES